MSRPDYRIPDPVIPRTATEPKNPLPIQAATRAIYIAAPFDDLHYGRTGWLLPADTNGPTKGLHPFIADNQGRQQVVLGYARHFYVPGLIREGATEILPDEITTNELWHPK